MLLSGSSSRPLALFKIVQDPSKTINGLLSGDTIVLEQECSREKEVGSRWFGIGEHLFEKGEMVIAGLADHLIPPLLCPFPLNRNASRQR